MLAREYKAEITLVLVTAFVISFMALLNDINRQIRIKELRIYLLSSNREDNNIDHIGLVMKYQLHKKMYENRLSQDEADLIESRVNAILNAAATDRAVSMDRYRYLSLPTLWTINAMRFLIGKAPIVDPSEDSAHSYLEAAYYYERNNCYARALEAYGRALDRERNNAALASSIILHQGYCQSILGNYNEAKERYQTVIRIYGDRPLAATAIILLRYIEGFKSELDRVLKEEPDSLEKSDKLYKLIALKEAMAVISRVEKTAPPAERARVGYLKGRIYEDLSEKEKAIDTYQGIVVDDPSSQYARLANRRIYLAGTTASNGAKVRNLAIINNRTLNDPVLKKMKDQEKKLVPVKEPAPRAPEEIRVEEEAARPVIDIEKLETKKKVEEADALARDLGKKIDAGEENAQACQVSWRITTAEGNIFVGEITAETEEKITLKTLIGNVTIPVNKIVKREKAR